MIYLTGGAAVPNYGDELIVDSWLRWYVDVNRVPPSDIKVNGSWPRVFSRLFASRYPGLRYSGEMRIARMAYRPSTFPEFAKIGYQYLDDPAHRDSAMMRDLEQTSLFHLHGGGYLNTTWPEHAFNAGIGAWVKDHLGATVVGTGLGLGPLPDVAGEEQQVLREVFSRFDVLEVRDDWSHEYVLRNGLQDSVILGLDDAFLMPVRTRRVDGSVLHLSVHSPDMIKRIAAQTPRDFIQSFDRIMFWVCTNADASNFATFAASFPSTEAVTLDTLIEAIPVGDKNYMLSARFHPHLMGARLGMAGAYVSRSPYYDVKHGSLISLGSSFTHTHFKELNAELLPARVSSGSMSDQALSAQKQELGRRITPSQVHSVGDSTRQRLPKQFLRRLPFFRRHMQ